MGIESNKNFTIVEIGNYTTKMLAGSFNGHSPYIYCVKEVNTRNCLKDGMIVNPTELTKAIKEVLNVKDETIATKSSMRNVWVVLPPNGAKVLDQTQSSAVMARNNNEGLIDRDDIKQLLNNIRTCAETNQAEIVDIIPLVYKYGDKSSLTPPYNEKATVVSADAHVHSVPSSLFKSHNNAFDLAGVEASGFGVAPYGASRLINQSMKGADVYLLVDLGGSSSSASIIGKGHLFQTLVLPEGMNSLTEAISKAFSISFEKAELIKRTYGYCLRVTKYRAPIVVNDNGRPFYQEELNNVILEWFKNFNIKFNATIEELLAPYVNGNSEAAVKAMQSCTIVAIGGGSNLQGIEELFLTKLGVHKGIRYVPNVVGARDSKYVNILGMLVAKCTSNIQFEDAKTTRALSRVQNQ